MIQGLVVLPREVAPAIKALLVSEDAVTITAWLVQLGLLGFELASRQVMSAEQFSAALTDGDWNVVLYDHSSQCFPVSQALATLRNRPEPIPLLVLSRHDDTDAAVGLLREGVSDFLGPKQLQHLGAIVIREVRDANTSRQLRSIESALETREATELAILTAVADAVLALDHEGWVSRSNPAARRLFKLEELSLGRRHITALLSAADGSSIVDRVRKHTAQSRGTPSAPFLAKAHPIDGRAVDVEVSVARLDSQKNSGFVISLRDVTERLLLEERLRRSQKLDAMSQLAAGLAHDFNNILHIILLHTDVCLATLSADDEIYSDLNHVREATKRGAAMIHQLLLLNRRDSLGVDVLDLCQQTRDLMQLFQPWCGSSIALSADLADEPCCVRVDHMLADQVMLNLLSNAKDAMPAGGSIRVQVYTTHNPHSPTHGSALSVVEGHDMVCWVVQDSGVGMPPEVLERVFEPFFTTKGAGKGTGLGLATVYSLAERAGGFVKIDSQVGKGTKVSLYLPRVPLSELRSPRSPRSPRHTLTRPNDKGL